MAVPDGSIPRSELPGVLGGDLLARLERFAADARVDEAAQRRSRERWLRAQAAEDASLHGILVDLAEREAPVAIHTGGQRSHHGVVRAVGQDFCAIRTPQGADVLLALDAVSSVRSLPSEDPTTGDRPLDLEIRLAEVLAQLTADRERVLVVPRDGGDALAGELRSLGGDVVSLRLDGEPRATAYVPLRGIAEVRLAR